MNQTLRLHDMKESSQYLIIIQKKKYLFCFVTPIGNTSLIFLFYLSFTGKIAIKASTSAKRAIKAGLSRITFR